MVWCFEIISSSLVENQKTQKKSVSKSKFPGRVCCFVGTALVFVAGVVTLL